MNKFIKENDIVMKKIRRIWEDNKDTIKNAAIVITVPLLITSLIGINRLNKIIKINNLWTMFYGKGSI
jgi:hypothetical protein